MNAVEIYTAPDGTTRLSVTFDQDTVWLSQKQLAELFGKDVRTVNEHIGNIIEEQELMPDSTIRKFRIVQKEGKREVAREIDHYSLDVIISVEYRIKSAHGPRFRQRATGPQRQTGHDVGTTHRKNSHLMNSLTKGCAP